MKIVNTRENAYEIFDLADPDYFSHKAASSHTLIDVIKANYDVDVASLPKALPKRSLEMGSIVHGSILEPERIEEICAENHSSLVVPDDLGILLKVLYASMNNDEMRERLKPALKEHTCVFVREGLASLKIKCDAINVDKGEIYDVKTISNITYRSRHIRDYGYFYQAIHYCETAKKVYDKGFQFYWDFVCKKTGKTKKVLAEPKPKHYDEYFKALESYDKFHKEQGTEFQALPVASDYKPQCTKKAVKFDFS